MRSTTRRYAILKLDHDPHNSRRLSLREIVRRARRANKTLVAMAERRSPSGRGWHRWLIVRPAPKSAVEVVALQLLFGSDPLREAYCLNRAVQIDTGKVRGYWARHFDVLYVAHRGRAGRGAP